MWFLIVELAVLVCREQQWVGLGSRGMSEATLFSIRHGQTTPGVPWTYFTPGLDFNKTQQRSDDISASWSMFIVKNVTCLFIFWVFLVPDHVCTSGSIAQNLWPRRRCWNTCTDFTPETQLIQSGSLFCAALDGWSPNYTNSLSFIESNVWTRNELPWPSCLKSLCTSGAHPCQTLSAD